MMDHLVHLMATGTAEIDSHLHEGSHIADPCDDTADGNQVSNFLTLNLAHANDALLVGIGRHEHDLVAALQLLRDALVGSRLSPRLGQALLGSSLLGALDVELALLHEMVEGRFLLLAEVDGRLGHVLLANVSEERGVALRVAGDAVDEAGVADGAEELADVSERDLHESLFFVGKFLLMVSF